MKSMLVRTLAVLTFTTWMSAFAATANSSENEAAKGCANQSQYEKKETKERQKTKNAEDKTRKSQKEVQEEKEYDRLLLGIHG
jgi:hypothetical protein